MRVNGNRHHEDQIATLSGQLRASEAECEQLQRDVATRDQTIRVLGDNAKQALHTIDNVPSSAPSSARQSYRPSLSSSTPSTRLSSSGNAPHGATLGIPTGGAIAAPRSSLSSTSRGGGATGGSGNDSKSRVTASLDDIDDADVSPSGGGMTAAAGESMHGGSVSAASTSSRDGASRGVMTRAANDRRDAERRHSQRVTNKTFERVAAIGVRTDNPRPVAVSMSVAV
jgi:hypothetical protein